MVEPVLVPAPTLPRRVGARVETRRLTRRFGGLTALGEVDLEIASGESFGLLGANGAGKTTFIRLALGFLLPTAGEIEIDGLSPTTDARAVQRRIGYVPETPRLYPELSVMAFLRFAAGLRELAGRDRDDAISEVVERFELEEVAKRPIGHLSKGYRQRVSLAQAFLHSPSLLIVDEPTSGLDPLQRGQVREALEALRGDCTLVLCTHDLNEARLLTDRVGVLKTGRLVALGPSEEVLDVEDPLELFRRGAGLHLAGRPPVIAFRALVRKEIAVLFGSPVAYLVLTMVALLTAITFFEHLRLYNHQLFLYASSNMAGFESDTIPDYINLRDTVFLPVMEQLGLLLLLPIPLVTMGVFAREKASGTDEFLLTSGLSPAQLVAAKFSVTFGFVVLMMAVSFIYPVTAILQGGLGLQHLLAVFMGLVLLGVGIASIGLVCSAATDSQLVAAALTVAFAYLFYDFGWTYAFVGATTADFLEAISLHPHFGRFSEGLVRLSDIVFFASYAAISATAVRFLFEARRLGA